MLNKFLYFLNFHLLSIYDEYNKIILGHTSSEHYDLILMICLIRHLTNIEVRDSLPDTVDTSEGADLARLKFYRNWIMFSDASYLSSETFYTWWNEIAQVK